MIRARFKSGLRTHTMLALLSLLFVVPSQLPEDPGPFPVGWRNQTFQDARFGQGSVVVRVYYPALTAGQNTVTDPAGGPYPVFGFQHGWLGNADYYDLLCIHLASWGYLVSSTNTETGVFPDRQAFARDTRAALWWLEDESANPASWLSGMADPVAPWSAAGHSMGGGTLSLLIGIEPRVRTIIGLQAAQEPAGVLAMSQYDGAAWWIAGGSDSIVPPTVVHDWYEEAGAASRRDLYWEVTGMGHGGCTDTPPSNEPLPGAEQHRLHRRLVTAVLECEVRGDENALHHTLGAGATGEPLSIESDCRVPALWAIEGGASILVGLAARANGRAGIAWSLALGNYSTPYGPLGFDPRTAVKEHFSRAGASGIVETVVPPRASWLGRTVGFSGIAIGAGRPPSLGRTALIDYP